jgi:hypothetical protein
VYNSGVKPQVLQRKDRERIRTWEGAEHRGFLCVLKKGFDLIFGGKACKIRPYAAKEALP